MFDTLAPFFFSSCDLGVLPKRCSGFWVYTTTENGSLRIDTTESRHAKNINSSNTIPVGIIFLSISFEAKLLIGQNFDILFCSKYFHNFKLPLNRKMRVNSSHYDSFNPLDRKGEKYYLIENGN